MRMELDNGGLRYITYNGVEIIRGIYGAVRDRDWNTIPQTITNVHRSDESETITVTFRSEHDQDQCSFVWEGTIRMTHDRIQFGFDGHARTSFLRNRIGFCLLLPISLQGVPLEVTTAQETIRGVLPEAIAPYQPFKNMKGMSYEPAPGMKVSAIFAGELFEMEDQRNWTDASYKIYCTPLDEPFPVQLQADQRVSQLIEVSIQSESAARLSVVEDEDIQIDIGSEGIGRRPDLGFVLSDRMPTVREQQWLSQLRPDHLRLVVDVSASNWRTRMEAAAQYTTQFGCSLELELLLDASDLRQAKNQLSELAHLISAAQIPVRNLLPYAIGTFVSDDKLIACVREALEEAGLSIRIGGGARTNYAEYNRASLPLAAMDFTAYAVNPQVHAFDDRSVMETLAAQRHVAADAGAKTGKPLRIGPITFKPGLNPNATSGTSQIAYSDRVDTRQHAMIGAAWTLGSIAAHCQSGMEHVQSLTYYELLGPIGLGDGEAYPLYHVFRDMGEGSDQVIEVSCSSDHVAVLALRSDEQLRLLLANTTGSGRSVRIHPGSYTTATVRRLDDSSEPAIHKGAVSRLPDQLVGQSSEPIALQLSPYAYACLTFKN